MANESNSSQSVISLPKGGGALHGLGEKFSPDLHTGTGNFTVPIGLPPGRNGFQPQLNLTYSTGNGNGPFGIGWTTSIPGVTRKTSDGVPRYNEASASLREHERRDVLILSGAEDLVPVSGSYPGARGYRPRTEGLFARIEHRRDPASKDDYWSVAGKDGLVSCYGTPHSAGSDPAVVANPGDPSRVFAWKLTETTDPFGNRIRYEYVPDRGERDGHRWAHPLLSRIRYADYGDPSAATFLVTVEFRYEEQERPDPFSDYRAGFEIRTTRRCESIRVFTRTSDGVEHSVREYRFGYQTNPHNGVSLLQTLQVIGFDDDGHRYDGDEQSANPRKRHLPPLTFGYTAFDPQKRRFGAVTGIDLPYGALGAADVELVDLHGSGLPDVLEMNGSARYWRNLGNGRFDRPRPMREAPPHALADPGVQLIDANGDGRMDLLVTAGSLAGYYPLTHSAGWDTKSFQPYRNPPSFPFDDPHVRLVDLDGDGYTDVLRSGSRMECFFNDSDPAKAWQRTNFAARRDLSEFPDVDFADARVRLADMTGDGGQDIALVHGGNVEYWPNLGHGNWGRRISMRRSPRFPFGYDARRILVGDVDGDGLADLVYVDHDRVLLWLNHAGNEWSAEPVEISGTPPVTDLDNVRLVDLYGTGVAGVLWSSDAAGLNRDRFMFLDFTGGQKPYLLNEVDSHMGAVTRVRYKPSTFFYLEDHDSPKTRWRTPLPFPVQVVAAVETLDEVSGGKLTTEYRYRHGYWDGAEREFRGFGMVEQFDTETIADYDSSELHGQTEFQRFLGTALERHFSPPTLTRTWFHQGPIGEEFGDWEDLDYTREYWPEDPQLLDHTGQVNAFLRGFNDRGDRMPSPGNRRTKRDALRTLRGSILRTELYALDGSDRAARPYTVTEHAYALREESPHIFFPHLVAQRVTQWERGADPLTQFAFTDDYDDFGQPRRHTSVAMPRRASNRRSITGAVVGNIQPDETHVLATHTRTRYASSPGGKYMHDRVAQVTTYEHRVDGQIDTRPVAPDSAGDDVQSVLRKQLSLARQVRDTFGSLTSIDMRVVSHVVRHYDGRAFEGLLVGELGDYGALVRVETLVLTEEILTRAYGDANSDRRPRYLDGNAAQPDTPSGFGGHTGYRKVTASGDGYVNGWYVDTERQQFDFHVRTPNPRGLVVAMRDSLGNETHIEEYEHQLLPTRVTDAAGLQTTAGYDYRVLQPRRMTDPNGTSTHMRYNPIGLPDTQFLRGVDAQGNETLGGAEDKPEIRFAYDLLHFERTKTQSGTGLPIFVHTTRRIHHASENRSDETIETREYSDALGRLVQTRAQAEEWIFGAAGDDVGLPVQAGAAPGPAVARSTADRVVVSGWQVFNNKGLAIERYEPFFSQGWKFEPDADARRGQHATMFYDPRGTIVRTLNPDGSQQRVILGRPGNPVDLTLEAPGVSGAEIPRGFEPTPWETYTYDANDLAARSTGPDGTTLQSRAPTAHHFTPSSAVIDALGRAICQVERNGSDPSRDWFVMRTQYDLRGNALKIVDALNRDTFEYAYDFLDRRLRVKSIDAGVGTSVLDARGNRIEYRDSKGSLARRTYDTLNRRRELWARDEAGGALTLRERIHYGDDGNHALARSHNTLGRPVKQYDEAGLIEMPEYDFKGNLLEKSRRTIKDTALASGWVAGWESAQAEDAVETTVYQTSTRYDALNRPTDVTCPRDVDGQRKILAASYNRRGALQAVALDNNDYVSHITYNAKGQRVLIAYGNGVVTRHTYDPQTFRLKRLHSQLCTLAIDPSAGVRTWTGAGAALQDFVYNYDLAGNITAIDERTANCGIVNSPEGRNRLVREFAYDPVYRLALATGRACKNIGVPRGLDDEPRCGFYGGGAATATQDNAPELTEGYTERFVYDPAGNMLELSYQATSGPWTRVFGMGNLPHDRWQDAPNNRLTTLANGSVTPAHSYQFDDSGNLILQDTDRRHRWDHGDRMIGYRVQPAQSTTASLEARYLYGADGMRVKKWVRNQQGQIVTTVSVDGAFEHHRQSDRGGMNENNTLHVMDQQNRIALVRVGAALDARDASPQVLYHVGDNLGSSHLAIGGNGSTAHAFINREEYFPYGETSFGSFARKRYRYNGKQRDEENGLYYYGARYLAPWLAKWVSCDPSGSKGGSTLYCYVLDNPLRYRDTLGLQADPEGEPVMSPRIDTEKREPTAAEVAQAELDDAAGKLQFHEEARGKAKETADNLRQQLADAKDRSTRIAMNLEQGDIAEQLREVERLKQSVAAADEALQAAEKRLAAERRIFAQVQKKLAPIIEGLGPIARALAKVFGRGGAAGLDILAGGLNDTPARAGGSIELYEVHLHEGMASEDSYFGGFLGFNTTEGVPPKQPDSMKYSDELNSLGELGLAVWNWWNEKPTPAPPYVRVCRERSPNAADAGPDQSGAGAK